MVAHLAEPEPGPGLTWSGDTSDPVTGPRTARPRSLSDARRAAGVVLCGPLVTQILNMHLDVTIWWSIQFCLCVYISYLGVAKKRSQNLNLPYLANFYDVIHMSFLLI